MAVSNSAPTSRIPLFAAFLGAAALLFFVIQSAPSTQSLLSTPRASSAHVPVVDGIARMAVRARHLQQLMEASCVRIGQPNCFNLEGYIFPEQSLAYLLTARGADVSTVCETGFNAGVSSSTFLEANAAATVYSFDVMQYAWSDDAKADLERTYPGRIHVTKGDSHVTIPQFFATNPSVVCDVAHVDGDHSKAGTIQDARDFAKRSHASTVLLLDDTFEGGPAEAWSELVNLGEVQELGCFRFDKYVQWKEGKMAESMGHPMGRGFCIGKFLKPGTELAKP